MKNKQERTRFIQEAKRRLMKQRLLSALLYGASIVSGRRQPRCLLAVRRARRRLGIDCPDPLTRSEPGYGTDGKSEHEADHSSPVRD